MKEFNIQADFAVSVAQFFDLFFQSAKFKLDFHVVRGDTEISVGDWKQTGNNKHERAIKFCSQVSDQAILKKLTGGMAPVVHEKQDYEFVGKELHVSSLATSSAGGFNCATTADYTITDAQKPNGSVVMNGKHTEHGGCHVDIVVKSEFKSRLFKGQVENMMSQQASLTFEQWIGIVKAKIVEFNKEEQVRRHNTNAQHIPIHPHPQDYFADTLSSSPSTIETSEYDTDDENYYDANDHLISPPRSRTHTPLPHLLSTSSSSSTSSAHHPPPGGMTGLIHSMQKELQQVRSMTEVNTSRLMGLEASKIPSVPPPSSSTPAATHNEGILPYLQRLDVLVKQQEEEAQRSREKEQEWRRKLEEMEKKVTGANARRMPYVPGGWVTVMVFLLVWPVVAQKMWKYGRFLQPTVVQMFWRLFGR